MEQIDNYSRPAPEDGLDSGDAGNEQSVDETLDLALTRKEDLSNESGETNATFGAITNMDAQNQDNWQDHPETDPFQDDR